MSERIITLMNLISLISEIVTRIVKYQWRKITDHQKMDMRNIESCNGQMAEAAKQLN